MLRLWGCGPLATCVCLHSFAGHGGLAGHGGQFPGWGACQAAGHSVESPQQLWGPLEAAGSPGGLRGSSRT